MPSQFPQAARDDVADLRAARGHIRDSFADLLVDVTGDDVQASAQILAVLDAYRRGSVQVLASHGNAVDRGT